MSETFTVDVPVRFRDLDPLDHVHHSVHASYIESARLAYAAEVLGLEHDELPFVVANLEISYERPITLDDDLQVAVWITDLGETSCTIAYELLVDGETVATAETAMVYVDPETKRPTAVPDGLREQIRAHEDLDSTA
ncbi:acyl-CoA thioesterase [Natrialbaceae archaeon A-arb3/5]